MINSGQVKSALRISGAGTPREVSARLGIEDAAGKLQVRQILRDLLKSGGAERYREGRYRLVDDPARRGGVQAKLWEFMCLRFHKAQPWTTREAAKKAECAWDYAKRYIKFLSDTGYIEPVGKLDNAILWRVMTGQEKEAAPPWNRRAEKRNRLEAGAAENRKPKTENSHEPDGDH